MNLWVFGLFLVLNLLVWSAIAKRIESPRQRALLLTATFAVLLVWLVIRFSTDVPLNVAAIVGGSVVGAFIGAQSRAPGPAWFVQQFRNRRSLSKGDAA